MKNFPAGIFKKSNVHHFILIWNYVMLMVCNNNMSTSNNNFSFFPEDFLKHLFKGLKSSLGSLLQSVWHIWVCFKYMITFWFSPWGIIPVGIFPHRIYPRRDFSPSAGYSSWEEFIQWKEIFSAFIHISIVYGMYTTQLLHVVVKQLGKLYFRFTWHKPKDRFSHNAAHIPEFNSKAAPVRATFFVPSLY